MPLMKKRPLKRDRIPLEPISDQISPRSDPELRGLNVEQRLALLRRQFAPDDPVKPTAGLDRLPWSLKGLAQNPIVRRSVKSAAAIALAGLVVWLPVQRLFQTTSVEAIVNARTLTLRAPIDGIVSAIPTSLAVGATFMAGTPLLHITNNRADRIRFDNIRRQKEHTQIEATVLKTRLASAERMHQELVEQT